MSDRSGVGRRQFLRSVGTVGTALSVAGCADAVGTLGGEDDVRVSAIHLGNRDEAESHTVDLLVRFDGAVVIDDMYELGQKRGETGGGTLVDEPLPNKSGEFVVVATLVGSDTTARVDVGAATSADCSFVQVQVFADERLAVTTNSRQFCE